MIERKKEYYSAIRKTETLPFATTHINLENIMLSAIGDTEKQIQYYLTYMWNLKEKESQTHRNRELNGGYRVGGDGEILVRG